MLYKQPKITRIPADVAIRQLTRRVERCERIYGVSSADMQQRFADDPSLCPWDDREVGQWMADYFSLKRLKEAIGIT